MSPLDPSEISKGRAGGFLKKSLLQPGQETEPLHVTDVSKAEGTKYPVRGETWCYRFHLSDGRVWDESSKSVYGALLGWLYPDGKTFTPCTVVLFKKSGLLRPKESSYGVKKVT